MDFAAWFDTIAAMSPLAIGAVALAGLVMGVAPSSLPLFSVVAGYVVGQAGERASERRTRSRGLLLSAGFVLGMATVDAAIGALFGFLGFAVIRVLAGYLALTNLFLAVLLTILGLVLLRKIRIVVPVMKPALRRVDSFQGAYGLGIPFGLSACPACTPMLLPILTAAAATGAPWWGALLLFVFGLARAVPLLLVGVTTGMMMHVRRLTFWVPRLERAGGILLLIAALYFLYQSAAASGFVPSLQHLLM